MSDKTSLAMSALLVAFLGVSVAASEEEQKQGHYTAAEDVANAVFAVFATRGKVMTPRARNAMATRYSEDFDRVRAEMATYECVAMVDTIQVFESATGSSDRVDIAGAACLSPDGEDFVTRSPPGWSVKITPDSSRPEEPARDSFPILSI